MSSDAHHRGHTIFERGVSQCLALQTNQQNSHRLAQLNFGTLVYAKPHPRACSLAFVSVMRLPIVCIRDEDRGLIYAPPVAFKCDKSLFFMDTFEQARDAQWTGAHDAASSPKSRRQESSLLLQVTHQVSSNY